MDPQLTEEQQYELYAMPMYQYNRVHSMDAGNLSNSFSTNLYGIAIGGETTNENWLLGLAVNFGKIDTSGSKASAAAGVE